MTQDILSICGRARGILFSAPMVRALLDGRKSQTRRLATFVQPDGDGWHVHNRGGGMAICDDHAVRVYGPDFAPHAPGDRLYVREAWSHTADGVFEISQARLMGRSGVIYRADENPKWPHAKYWPSIHMPREFSRLTLIVEAVKVERVQAISRDDAIAEGLIHKAGVIEPDWWMLPEPHHQGSFLSPVAAYRWLWNDLHTKPGERWEDNPWVVATTFRVLPGNIDQLHRIGSVG